MKKMLSIALALVMILACGAAAFAEGEASADAANIKVEETLVMNEDSKQLHDHFYVYFYQSHEIQRLAGEDGIVLKEVLDIFGDFSEPHVVELELENPQSVIGLLKLEDKDGIALNDKKPLVYEASYNKETGKVEVLLDQDGEFSIARRVTDYRLVVNTVYEAVENTVMIDSVEYKEMALVERQVEDYEAFDSHDFIVIPGDDTYKLSKEERDAFRAAVEEFSESFRDFVNKYPQYADSAPAESFFLPAFTVEQAELLPLRQIMKINDADIFTGLAVKTANGWKPVEAEINENGYLVFTLAYAGTYVILAQAA